MKKKSKKKLLSWSKEQREWFHKRDQVCQLCGGREIEIHHIAPISNAYSFGLSFKEINSPENGICLCHLCHEKIHSKSWKNRFSELSEIAIRNTKKFGIEFPKH